METTVVHIKEGMSWENEIEINFGNSSYCFVPITFREEAPRKTFLSILRNLIQNLLRKL
jgi:hypothetical protein